jgi:hypothetical protein
MKHTLLLVEGPDDIRALHEILDRELHLEQRRTPTITFFPGRERVFLNVTAQREIHITNVQGKEDLSKVTIEKLQEEQTLQRGIDRFGVCFDPDDHDDTQWKQWFTTKVLKGFVVDEVAPLGYRLPGAAPLEIIPLPWDAGDPFDDLDGKRLLERVAIGILQKATTPKESKHRELVLKLLKTLQDEGQATSWKTAFRLLHAVRDPANVEGFFSKVFGQDDKLRAGIRTVLTSTLLWQRLCFLCEVSAVEPSTEE